VHAVIDANGAGKLTLIKLLSGEIALSSGEIRFAGQYITTLAQPRRARLRVGRSYPRTTIFPGLLLLENCCLAARGAPEAVDAMASGAVLPCQPRRRARRTRRSRPGGRALPERRQHEPR